VRVFEKDRMVRAERDAYFDSKPVGVIFRVGALVSFIVGMVIFYQILSTETVNHLREYATLKALGFGDLRVYLIGIRQALLYASASYAGSALLSIALFHLISQRARMELRLDLTLAAVVLAFTLFMAGVAAALALRRVRTADPAELF
jgi:putative ABC transport system permease protein